MTRFRVKIKINGSVQYKGKKLKHNQIVDEYDMELVQLVEQKLVKVERIDISEIDSIMKEENKKKKKKDSDGKPPELD